MAGLNNPKDAHCLFTDEKDFSVAVKYLQNIGKNLYHLATTLKANYSYNYVLISMC